ncbi:MAG: galactose oxidase, partial [Betaproteobacteria bacterium]|nr:galactose oxidase [Betaproteobacteria bacterium]
ACNRRAAGAVSIGNTIYFAGGAPVAGTTFLTSVNEAFSPG